ncbi:putative phage abortive infection protein [Methylomonas albis]|uniref:Phage abortive infection protein n=1 Tax=Methylomonas albis TaxID=1854563 RepID=A0ABR9CVE2_9GAMM|nr:putative phage abortive infection protein [Methylomonas albis]MBD9354813.1 putative phage abortive infection protein [Methylomonas albis]
MNNKKSLLKKDVLSIVVVVVLSIFVIAQYVINFGTELSANNADWGTFGDYIGGTLNPVIAGFAFYWIIQSYRLQKDELSDTRKILQYQNSVLNKQNFESTFFQLASLLNEIIKNLSLEGMPEEESDDKSPLIFSGVVTNRKCIQKLHDILKNVFLHGYARGDYNTSNTESVNQSPLIALFDAHNSKIGEHRLSPRIVIINTIYDDFYNEYGHIIGHYFRTVYNIIKFVDIANIEENEKKIYTNLIRAQLSKFELALLFYNSLNPKFGLVKFLPLMKKYDLLTHLENEVLVYPDDRDIWNEITYKISTK